MTLTSELDDATPISSPVSCNSLKDASPINGEPIHIEFPSDTYLCPETNLILNLEHNQDCLVKIEVDNDERFSHKISPQDFKEIPVISISVKPLLTDEEHLEQPENDAVVTEKLPTRSNTFTNKKPAPLPSRDYLMVLATFLIALIAKGNSAGLSVLTVEWLQQFDSSKALILYVPALNFAFTSAAGVIDGILINKYGIFSIILFGCFLEVFCLIISSFSTNAITLVIVLGFLAGLGNCFLFVNAFIFIGVHFGKAAKPIIAFLSVAGPIGGLIFPNLIPIFIELYGWRGCMFILAGINLQVAPLAAFLYFTQKDSASNQTCQKVENSTKQPSSSPKLLDLSVLKNFLFVMYIFSVSLTVGGVNTVFSMLPDFLYEKGLDLKTAAKLYAMYYILSSVPRILIGLIMKYTNVNFIHIYITMASLFGLTMALMNLAESYVMLSFCCMVMALWMGCPAGLYPIGILELIENNKHSSGQSIVETSYGITTALFGFLAGLLVEYTNSYRQPFYIYGTSIVVINICLLIATSAQQLRLKLEFSKLADK